MLRTVLTVGLLAGLAAGVFNAALQHVTTVPLIIAAEAYEGGGAAPAHHHDAATAAPADTAIPTDATAAVAAHDHGAEAWAPGDGLGRTVSTAGATVVSGVGLAFVLIALMLLAGERITPLTALGWAAGGFAATGLATGLGLSPELPGSASADLVARQVWWIGTAAATGVGLYALIKLRTPLAIAVGAGLLVLPHLIGAPHPQEYASTAPAELAAHFASTSLAVHAAFWAVVGVSVGVLWPRLAPS